MVLGATFLTPVIHVLEILLEARHAHAHVVLPCRAFLAGNPSLTRVFILLGGTADTADYLFFGLRLLGGLLSFLASFLRRLGLIEGVQCFMLTLGRTH